METDELELDTLGDSKSALFVILSDTDSTFNFVAALMYSQLFNLLCDKADDFYGGRLPVHVRLILDESFADFADEADNTFIRQDLLDRYRRLYVVKSISKSYGVPGLRLGVLASGDQDLIAALKKDVAIWNINSFAEFYMQIEEKYKKDYARALELIRAERARFRRELEKLPNLRVIPSQANYLMVELLGGLSARAITRELLVNRCILVKDLSPKLGGQQYLRLAVRDTRDNDRLLEALRPLCGA